MNNNENNTNNTVQTSANMTDNNTYNTVPTNANMTDNNISTNTLPNQNNVNQNFGGQSDNVSNQVTGSPAINTVQPSVAAPVITNVVTDANPTATNISSGNTSNTLGSSTVTNEKLKNVEINYTPPSKAKTFFTIFMFIFIIGFVVFLPEITAAVNMYKASKNAAGESIITTGRLECELISNTTNLDVTYSRVFKFTDSKLYEANFEVTTRGDPTLDEQALSGMAAQCSLLKTHTASLSGVDVDCSYSEGKLVESQKFKYANLDMNELDAAFTEAGGTYPEFKNEQNIDNIEKNMNAAGYTCQRKN